MLHKNTIQPRTLELLTNLQSEKILNNFYLAGGTSLALQIGHRQSIDLDFFTTGDFDELQGMELVPKILSIYILFSKSIPYGN